MLSEGRVVAPESAAVSEWNDADRFCGGLELLKMGKAPLLILHGGTTIREHTEAPEGDVLAEYARSSGAPEGQIATTSRVRSTENESDAVAMLLRGRFGGRSQRSGHWSVLLNNGPRATRRISRSRYSKV